jgi:hypothetical protein
VPKSEDCHILPEVSHVHAGQKKSHNSKIMIKKKEVEVREEGEKG